MPGRTSNEKTPSCIVSKLAKGLGANTFVKARWFAGRGEKREVQYCTIWIDLGEVILCNSPKIVFCLTFPAHLPLNENTN